MKLLAQTREEMPDNTRPISGTSRLDFAKLCTGFTKAALLAVSTSSNLRRHNP